MQYIIGLFLALVAIAIAVWLLIAAVMVVLLPFLLVLTPVALILGIALSLAGALLTLAGANGWRPGTVTPDAVVQERAGLPKRPAGAPFGRDWAWPGYLVSQWRVDLRTATKGVTKMLRWGWRWVPGGAGWLLLPGYVLWSVVNAGAVIGAGLVLVPLSVIGGAAWVGWLVVVGTLRRFDNLIQRHRQSKPSCTSCYYLADVPAFPCKKCGRLHRDIRPGRLGGAWRRCGCGAVMPTTVLRAAHKIRPHCPRCEQQYPEGAAVLTDIRIPVFGPVSAGKTRLVRAGLVAMRDQAAGHGATVKFANDYSQTEFDTGVEIVTTGGNTAKTAAGQLPTAITAQLKTARDHALLHLFDAAGEFYTTREDNSDLEFLDHAQGLVFVVDPFSIPWVSDQLGGLYDPRVARANPAVDDPEQVYHITAQRLRDYHIKTKRQYLAVVVVKADLLAGTSPTAELSPETVREWLNKAGLDNLVLSAERDFAEVRYFLAASVHRPAAGMSPATPFTWLAGKAGVELAPQQNRTEEPV